jgi:hypothetical protein
MISTPATPASLQNKSHASDNRMDAMESNQSITNKRSLVSAAKIEEIEDCQLNET